MKYFYLLIIILIAGISCEKPDNEDNNSNGPITIVNFDPKITKVINDSTITLSWPKYRGKRFSRYVIKREAYYLKNGKLQTYYDWIDSTTNINDTIFTETKMPATPKANYYIYAETSERYILAQGALSYNRPMYTLMIGSMAASLIDKQSKLIYVPQSNMNRILVIDYTTGIFKKEIATFDIIGRLEMGEFNGNKELYVPSYRQGVNILDASTYNYKESIGTGLNAHSVVPLNGKLYISTTDTAGGKKECIKVFDRATKKLLAETGYGDIPSLLLLPGATPEIAGVAVEWNNGRTNYFSSFQLDNTGIPVSKKQYIHTNESLGNPEGILRAFPDGNRFIAGSHGLIINKSMTVEGYLNKNTLYLDYEFNDDGSLIYAADTDNGKIDVISYPSGTIVKSYRTTLNPFRIYRDGNTLICLNADTGVWGVPINFIVERIEL